MSLVSVQNVTKVYPDGTQALFGVSFEIERGEFVAIMGPSGSGKSTLLHILGFLDRHTDGTYTFKGKTMDDFEGEEIARVRNDNLGFVFQAFNLLPRISVLENVMMPLYYSDIPEREWEERARKVLDMVGLSHRVEFEPKKLSGGEKQRVAIARALVCEPDVVFADEPTGNLDTATGEIIMGMLQQLNDEGHTIIVITHEDDIAEHAQRIIRIRDGKLEKDEKVKKQKRVKV